MNQSYVFEESNWASMWKPVGRCERGTCVRSHLLRHSARRWRGARSTAPIESSPAYSQTTDLIPIEAQISLDLSIGSQAGAAFQHIDLMRISYVLWSSAMDLEARREVKRVLGCDRRERHRTEEPRWREGKEWSWFWSERVTRLRSTAGASGGGEST